MVGVAKLRAGKATTPTEAQQRAGTIRTELRRRSTHPEVVRYCTDELLAKNNFHATLEATKSIPDRLRALSGLTTDGADLVQHTLAPASGPRVAINGGRTKTDRDEQSGFANLVIGLLGLYRNPTAHDPRLTRTVSDDELLEALTTISMVHRRLDDATVADWRAINTTAVLSQPARPASSVHPVQPSSSPRKPLFGGHHDRRAQRRTGGGASRCITENRLACYAPALRDCDDALRLRIVLHGFGTVWRDADSARRVVLAAEEPERLSFPRPRKCAWFGPSPRRELRHHELVNRQSPPWGRLNLGRSGGRRAPVWWYSPSSPSSGRGGNQIMISDDALELMDRLAREIGFGSRDDYPHLGQSPISAGDWKGLGIVACVFADTEHASRWVEECTSQSSAVDELAGTVVSHGENGFCVAVITGIDLGM